MLFPSLSCPRSSCEIPHTWQSKLRSQPDFPSISPRFLARGQRWRGESPRGFAALRALLCIALRSPGARTYDGNGRSSGVAYHILLSNLQHGCRRTISPQQSIVRQKPRIFVYLSSKGIMGRIISYMLKYRLYHTEKLEGNIAHLFLFNCQGILKHPFFIKCHMRPFFNPT